MKNSIIQTLLILVSSLFISVIVNICYNIGFAYWIFYYVAIVNLEVAILVIYQVVKNNRKIKTGEKLIQSLDEITKLHLGSENTFAESEFGIHTVLILLESMNLITDEQHNSIKNHLLK